MFKQLIRIPKTKAGQLFGGNDYEVIKERITSYGSMAIVKQFNSYIVVYWDNEVKSFAYTVCNKNTRLIRDLWSEIV